MNGYRHQVDANTVLNFGSMFIDVQTRNSIEEPMIWRFHYTDEERKELVEWLYLRCTSDYIVDSLIFDSVGLPWQAEDLDTMSFSFRGTRPRDPRYLLIRMDERECTNLANALALAWAFTPNDYQGLTKLTAEYYGIPVEPIAYLAMGLAGESGEVADKVKKLYRDHNGILSTDLIESISSEIADSLWYCARLLDELGVPLEEAMHNNLAKLQSRVARGTLHGNGDKR